MSNRLRSRGPFRGLFILFLWGSSGAPVGCGDLTHLGELGFVTVQEIGDTTILTTQRSETLDTAHLVQVARIGRFDGPEEHLIMFVEAFAVGWRGEVYVADEGIRVFSPDGSEVRRIARRGQGPGEVGVVTALEVDENGRLLAVDIRNRRVAVFDTSGAVLNHWRLPYGRPGYGRSSLVPIPGSQTLLYLNSPLDPSAGPQVFPRPIFVRLDSTGAILDTVFAPVRLTEGCPTLDDPHFGGTPQDVREAMFPKVKWTASRSGEVVLGCPAEYEIDRVQLDGAVFRISHEREPITEPSEVRRAFVENIERGWERRGLDRKWKGPEPPEQKPYYHRMIVGRGGRLWVWPGHPREPYHSPDFPGRTFWAEPMTGTFDVFDSDGRFLGPVLLPDGAQYEWRLPYEEPFFAGDTVWIVRRDSLDVRYVDRMRIEW